MTRLFDQNTITREFADISVSGFTKPVPGVIFTDENPPCCGVPLGGIGTGCVDYDLRGFFGWSSIFNPFSQLCANEQWRVPRRYPDIQPVFGFSIGERCYCLTTPEVLAGGKMEWCTAPKQPQHYVDVTPTPGVTPAKSIKYYGHFPIADAEYDFDAPISAGIRAWSSFIPGDSAKTNIPAAIFEVHLRNISNERLCGKFAMNFSGPNHQEARSTYFTKTRIEEKATGLFVCSEGGVNYFLGVYDENDVMTGTGLAANEKEEYGYGTGYFGKQSAWSTLNKGLPQDQRFIETNGARRFKDPSASVGLSFDLGDGETRVFQFVLTWYAPVLDANVKYEGDIYAPEIEPVWQNDACYGAEAHYYQMYATAYDSALDIMRRLGGDREELLKKVFSWQEVLLTNKAIPMWLRDSLLNILCLLTENGYWFMPKYPLGDWAFPGGAFTYFESPRDCPHSSCIPNDWISSMHLLYLFPDLYRQLLRSYKAAQRPDGEIPFAVGRCGELANFSQPEYTWQMSLNGSCYIMMIDRLWVLTGDDKVLEEFYDSIKSCHKFMSTLAKNGWLCIPDEGGSEWFEFSKFYGYTSHVGGIHLSQLLIVERIARKMGDDVFAEQCRREYEEAKDLLNDKLWIGTHYLTWLDEETGRKNDDVMAYQLDSVFINAQAGISERMCENDRIKTVIDTIFNANVKLGNGYGALNYAQAGGKYMADETDGYGQYAIFAQNTIVLAMTCMYCGEYDLGLSLAETTWRNLIINQGLGWDMTHIVHAQDGHKLFGTDYNQMSVIWSLLAAIEGTDVSGPAREGHIVAEILKSCK